MAVFPVLASTMVSPGCSSPRSSAAHGEDDAVLHAAGGVAALQLGEDADAGLRGEALEFNERRIADQVEERWSAVVGSHASILTCQRALTPSGRPQTARVSR
jgi:hypothetical protein